MTPAFPKSYKISSKPSLFCPGCGHPLVLTSLAETIDQLKIQGKSALSLDIGCSLLAWDFLDIPTFQTHHGRTIPTAIGFKIARPAAMIFAYVGDGGAYAIGLQSLLYAAHRGDPITVIVVNNTIYAMTGGQLSPTTLPQQPTDTMDGISPLQGAELVSRAAPANSFIARASIDDPDGIKKYLLQAIHHQKKNRFSLVEILSVCPINWQTKPSETFAFLEKMKKTFPLGIINRDLRCETGDEK